jgi:uncharacterized protein YyaL (SSP411 family)
VPRAPIPKSAFRIPHSMNRLADALSPYLRQHADNPVHWREWGEEAFAEARRRDVPVFLSIGYATCHWCHVMAHESFEDEGVARLLADSFVSVKVDREERPDVDHVYMSACQLVTGRGGWPLSAFITPDGRPFWVGTYVPKESRGGRLGMMQLVPAIAEAWRERRGEVEEAAERLAEALRKQNDGEARGEGLDVAGGAGGSANAPDAAGWLRIAFDQLARRYDAEHAGFGGGGAHAPKFPAPHNLTLLLRLSQRSDFDARERGVARAMATETLDAMRAGGLFDHVGGGFHRYSTDRRWVLPHFEKMLYDQATLLKAYAEGYRATGEARFAHVAREITAYAERDLGAPGGLFFSAEDADSLTHEGEHREGAFYVWTQAELRTVLGEVLGEDRAQRFAEAYGVEARGNFEDEATRRRTGENVLFLPQPLGETAKQLGAKPDDFEREMAESRRLLFEARGERHRPLLDDKILTDWNALYLGALAEAAQALAGEEAFADDSARYAEASERCIRALLALMQRSESEGGGLWHRARYADGEGSEPTVGIAGMLDDYAFLASACLSAYEATGEIWLLQRAVDLAGEIEARFAAPDGGYFMTEAAEAGQVGGDLFVRPREIYDGAMPSGTSAHALTLARLYRLTGEARYQQRSDAALAYAAQQTEHHPAALTALLHAADLATAERAQEVVIVGTQGAGDTEALLRVARSAPSLRRTIAFEPQGAEASDRLAEIAPFTAAMTPGPDGEARAYVCHGFACEAPTTDPETLRRALS